MAHAVAGEDAQNVCSSSGVMAAQPVTGDHIAADNQLKQLV